MHNSKTIFQNQNQLRVSSWDKKKKNIGQQLRKKVFLSEKHSSSLVWDFL